MLQSIKSKEEFNSEHKFIIDKVNQKDLNQIQSLQIQNFGYSDILEVFYSILDNIRKLKLNYVNTTTNSVHFIWEISFFHIK